MFPGFNCFNVHISSHSFSSSPPPSSSSSHFFLFMYVFIYLKKKKRRRGRKRKKKREREQEYCFILKMGLNNGWSIFCVFKVENVYFVYLNGELYKNLLSLLVLDLSSSPGCPHQFSVSLSLNLFIGLMYLGVRIVSSYYCIDPFTSISLLLWNLFYQMKELHLLLFIYLFIFALHLVGRSFSNPLF